MGRLIYSLTTSIDGYISDKKDNFEWANPSEEVLACVNHNLRNVGTFLFGRKVYETMAVWDSIPLGTAGIGMNDFAQLWQSAKKIVYSRTLTDVMTANTTLERSFDPMAVLKMVKASEKDVNIGGPHLAAKAIRVGIVDEYHRFIAPIILGNGNHWLPRDIETKLELVNVQQFDNGFVHLFYSRASQSVNI